MRKVFIIMFVLLQAQQICAQTPDKNLQKYWYYRERLQDFMVVGTGQGASIPAGERGYGGDKDFLKWGDGTVTLAFYLEMLATEYRLLKNNNQPVGATVHELFCALEAINRLDLAAEPAISNGNMAPILNGFYLRDDVDSNFVTRNRNKLNSNKFKSRSVVTRVSSDFWYGEQTDPSPATRDKIPQSLDQTNHLLVGLALVADLVDSGTLDGTNVFSDGQASIKQEAKDITNRLLSYLKNNDWVYRDPYYTDYCTFSIIPNPNINNNVYGRVGLNDCKAALPGLNTGMNAMALSYGFASAGNKISGGNYFDATTDKYHKLWELFHKDELCYAAFSEEESEKWLELAAINDDWHATVTPCSWATFFVNPVGGAIFNLCDALVYAASSGTVINDGCVLISPVNTTAIDLSTMCQLFNYEYIPLVHQVLYGGANPAIPNSFYTGLLDVAPCHGPYNFGLDVNGTPDRTTYEWSSNTRLLHPDNRGRVRSNGSGGEYNGLDYMVYFNLYCLVNDTYLDDYRKMNMDVSILPDFPITFPIIGTYGNSSNPAKILSFNTIEASNTIGATGVVEYKAGDRVFLKPGFKTENGAHFVATTEPIECSNSSNPMYYRTANATDSLQNNLDTISSIATSGVSTHLANNTNTNVEYTELATIKKDEVLKSKQKLPKAFLIYPNPNNGEFVLELSNAPKGNYTLQITDAVGRSVMQQNYAVQEQNLKQNINLQQQGKGIYFVKINSEQINEVRKVVVE